MLIALQSSIADVLIQWWLCSCKAPAKRCLSGAVMQRSMLCGFYPALSKRMSSTTCTALLRQVFLMKPAQDEQRSYWLGRSKAVTWPY